MSDELVFFDASGASYTPAMQMNLKTGRATYRAKPRHASNKTADALEFTSIEDLARAMLINGMAGRINVPGSSAPSYLRFGAKTLVRYQLDPGIASRLKIPASGGVPDSGNQVLRHFDWNIRFREERKKWSDEQTRAFTDFVLSTHDAGMDWYFVSMGKHELRFGNKSLGKIDATEVLGRVDGTPPIMKLIDRAPESLQVFDTERVLVNERLVAWANEHREVLATRARRPNTAGYWPDDYLEDDDAIAETSVVERDKVKTAPTNLILYGPPGTGKTFATAREAVRLCDGEASENREMLMARYRVLCDEKRIEFVTFHQSMAYEEFIEGLRPTTDFPGAEEGVATPGENASGAGFRLVTRDGVFKRISERARKSEQPDARQHLDSSRSVFKISLGERRKGEHLMREGLDNNVIHLGWGGEIDWSDARFDHFDTIKSTWREIGDPAATNQDANIVTMGTFRAAMQVGDYVIVSEGRDLIRAVGQIEGDYRYQAGAEHPHRRAVTWLWKGDEAVPRAPIYGRNFRQHSVYQLAPEAINWEMLDALVYEEGVANGTDGKPHVLIIDEVNRANISKVFGELITLLEADKRLGEDNELKVTLPYSGVPFGVPSNLHIVATMNTADRSIALIDKALRRRFDFRELMPDYTLPEMMATVGGIDVTLGDVLRSINDRIEFLADREHQIGHAWIMNCNTKERLDRAMRDRVIPLIAEYFFEDWSRVADVLGGDVDNPFLEAQELKMRGHGESRKRWSIRESFAPDAYARLIRGV